MGLLSIIFSIGGANLWGDKIDDFTNGLANWTVQSNVADVVAKPGESPVIAIKNNNATFTVVTSNAVGMVGDFDIAVSFAGSSGMLGYDSYGLVFSFQNINNYYIAYVFPGYPQSAFRVEKVVNGTVSAVYAGSDTNHDVGFTFSRGNDNNTVKPDALRIKRVGNNFNAYVADSSIGGWLSFTGSSWTDSTLASGLVGFGERYDGNDTDTTGTRFAMFGEGTTGINAVLASTDLTLQQSVVIPEAGTWLLLGGSFSLLLMLRRNRVD